MTQAAPADVAEAVGAAVKGRLALEWRATGFYASSLDKPVATGFAAQPRDFRPPDATLGRAVLGGAFPFLGAELKVEPGGDPWNRPSPSKRLAVELHRFAWLPSLLGEGEAGAREALRLWLGWSALFGRRPAPFAWGAETLERRLFNLLCGARRLSAVASDAEAAVLAQALARQARHLFKLREQQHRRAQQLAVTALTGAALAGAAGDRLLAAALPGLALALDDQVLADGGLRSRAPEQGMELLFDLTTLDDALLQRDRPAPPELSRALDRLTGATRVFALGDGRLAAFQGGGAAQAARVAAALSYDEGRPRAFEHAPHSGYHRLTGRRLEAIVDAAPAASGAWSVDACAQPLALEIVCDGDRLIANTGWTPDAAAPQGLRLTGGGSTLELDGASAGRPYTGLSARLLGPRLVGGAAEVEAAREDLGDGVWLDLAHDGWASAYGLVHRRRLHLDMAEDALRGEDRLAPASAAPRGGRRLPFAVRFHLPPEVHALVSRDSRSVLLRGPSEAGWWLRSDAPTSLEPSVHVEDGCARRAGQIVLRGVVDETGAARVRWKLSPVEPAPVAARTPTADLPLDPLPQPPPGDPVA